ncbi:MAG: ATP-binding protein, partial [Thermomicrobiales bacterium]
DGPSTRNLGDRQHGRDQVRLLSLKPIPRDHEAKRFRDRVVGTRPLIDMVRAALREREMLLLPDNMEHVIAAAPFVVDLLMACSRLNLLVTSRTMLRLSGEHAFPVTPLAPPDHPEAARLSVLPTALANYDAIRLCVARAQAVKPDFALTEANAGPVAEICRRVDGLPLAIELAATQSRMFAPANLLARMERRLPRLTGGPRDAPARLQTMANAIAWSDGPLTPDERVPFRRLAVFVNGFTIEVAEAVVRATGALGIDVLEGLGALVDKSLVWQAERAGDDVRFGMLETIREFGLEKLAESGEEATARDAHAQYLVNLAERWEPDLRGPKPWAIYRRLEVEIGNIRGALTWLYGQGMAEPGLRLTIPLYWNFADAISVREGRTWIDQFLTLPDPRVTPVLRARALCIAVGRANRMGDYAHGRSRLEEALAIFRAADDRRGIAYVLRSLGNVEIGLEAYERAETLLLDAEALARSEGDLWNLSAALGLLGVVARAKGQPERSLSFHRESRDLARIGSHEGDAMTASIDVAFAALELNDLAEARAAGLAALDVSWRRHDLFLIVRCLIVGGSPAAATGQMRQAVRLLGRAIALEAERGTRWLPAHQATCDRWLAAARAALDEAAFADAWATGGALPLERATDETRALLIAPDDAERPVPTPTDSLLTPRELDVLRLIAVGRTNRQIAAALFVERRTVTTHVTHILAKLGVATRTEAATYAIRHGLV